ncbi:MAG: class II fructose-bisphosphate aldolase [bacterium]
MTSYADAGLKIRNNHVVIVEPTKLRSRGWDAIIYAAVFGDRETKIQTRWVIGEVARLRGVRVASINALYKARARQELDDNFTVPAINLRGLVYDSARAIFSTMNKHAIGAVIFELSAGEMEYTAQTPEEYATVVLAAAVREGFRGPVFLQADHTQLRASSAGVAQENEKSRLQHHIKRCIRAGFFNIDIDASTLVDTTLPSIVAQQQANVDWTVRLARYVRDSQPVGLSISIGGEIGHIGDKNSTVEDFSTFITGVNEILGKNMEGISKVSVQTGTSHGGVVNKDGTLAKMTIDFDVLKDITVAGKKYEVGGSVQHGASTLPDSEFHLFPKAKTLEIHLATGWQNILFDSPNFPKDLKNKIYTHLLTTKKDNTQTDAQHIYKSRKRAWGDFKQEIWDIDTDTKAKLRDSIAKKADKIFSALNIAHTLSVTSYYALIENRVHTYREYQGD